jgi:hypothetical protein
VAPSKKKQDPPPLIDAARGRDKRSASISGRSYWTAWVPPRIVVITRGPAAVRRLRGGSPPTRARPGSRVQPSSTESRMPDYNCCACQQ